MKETTCVSCSAKIGIDDKTVYGQHILCPYCGSKFSYLEDSAEFSEERLAYAIAERRKDAMDNRYYSAAPSGARLYIGLVFYGKVFGDGMNVDAYMSALSEVEPELKAADWEYLLEHENDAELAEYFRNKLAEGQGDDRRPTKKIAVRALPKEGVLHAPVRKAPQTKNPIVVRRQEEAERHRQAANVRPRPHAFGGKLVVAAGAAAAVLVGVILYLAVSPGGDDEPVSKLPVQELASAPVPTVTPQDELIGAITNGQDVLQKRKDDVQKSLAEIREDQRRFESELGRVIEAGNMAAAEARAKGRVRLNGAETAMSVLQAPFFKALAGRYCGGTSYADICHKKVQDALNAGKKLAKADLEAINELAVSYQESAVGELRRNMEQKLLQLTGTRKRILEAARTLQTERMAAYGLDASRTPEKLGEINRLIQSEAFTDSCQLPPLASAGTASPRDGDNFTFPAAGSERESTEAPEPVETPEPTNTVEEQPEEPSQVQAVANAVSPKQKNTIPKDEKAAKEAELVPSNMSLAMFKSGRIKNPTVFKVKIAVAAYDGHYFDRYYSTPPTEMRDRYWAVRVHPYLTSGDDEDSRLMCFVPKDSPAGKVVPELLKDGAFHPVIVRMRYSEHENYQNFCLMDEIRPISSDAASSQVSAKFFSTRIGITMGERYDYLQGKIAISFRSKLKYFKKPIVRVILLTEENGSRVVRDCIMDEPNVKVIEQGEDLDYYFSRNYYRYTTTRSNERNEPFGIRRTVEEISASQSDVAKDTYKSVTYEGLPLDKQIRNSVKGHRLVHLFGYSIFDKDERAKLLGYRIEAWHDGVCIGVYDSVNKQRVKKFQIPEDWYISFLHPKTFKYRSPFSKKNVVLH